MKRHLGTRAIEVLAAVILVAGCGRERRLPTAVPPAPLHGSSVSKLEADPEHARANARHRRLSRRALVAEAKLALGAVLSGEQVYFQRWATYTDAADAAELRQKLHVDLSTLDERWAFSVVHASTSGFVARAIGREHTAAEDLVVRLVFVRGQPWVWKVRVRR